METPENDREQSENLPTACPTQMRAFTASGNIVYLACDQWKCDYCRQVLSYRWGQRVRYGLALWGNPARLFTLTMPSRVKSPAFAFALLPKIFDNFRKYMQRHVETWDYIAFVELHPQRKGIAHLHIVSCQRCPTRLKDAAHKAGFGYIADDQEIVGKEASYYVAKYTSKQGKEMPKNFRRVRHSGGWPDLPEPAYEERILPRHKAERVPAYLVRVAWETNIPFTTIRATWELTEPD